MHFCTPTTPDTQTPPSTNTPTLSNVSDLRVSTFNDSSITFAWDNPNTSANESFAGVFVEVANNSSQAPNRCTSNTAPTSASMHTINNLTYGFNYSIRVCSHTTNANGATPQISGGVTLTQRAAIPNCPGAVGSLVTTDFGSGMLRTRIIDGRMNGSFYNSSLIPKLDELNEDGTVDYAFMFCSVPFNSSIIIGRTQITTGQRGKFIEGYYATSKSLFISTLFSTDPTNRYIIFNFLPENLERENIGLRITGSGNGTSNPWGQQAADGSLAPYPNVNSLLNGSMPLDARFLMRIIHGQLRSNNFFTCTSIFSCP